MDIAVIGSNNVDLISYIDRMPIRGETVEAPGFAMGCGGKGANQAVAASRLGSKVLMVTRVGDDLFADNTMRNFADNGIDTAHVMTTPGTSGVAPIFVGPDSHNSIIIVKGANNALSPADVQGVADEVAGCKLIVLQLEVPLETVYAAIELGVRVGVPVLLNPAPAATELDLDIAAEAEYLVPNETELATLTGMPTGTIDEISAAASTLLRRGCPNVIVTLGERGCLWLTAQGRTLIGAAEVDAVDTTGAGDAFIGAFSHRLVGGASIPDALRFASAYAADSVRRRGTQTSYATAEEFARRRRRIPVDEDPDEATAAGGEER